jgi:serine/threonine-protein kinase
MSAMIEHASDQTLQLPLADAPREPAPGDLLAGRYRVLAPIADGGMARVFRARDERLRRDVALKIQRAGAASAPMREERAASAVFHPHVVAVFDGGQLPDGEPGAGAAFIVMEYVPGPTACDIAPLDCARAINIVCQAAEGLAAAHAAGVIHNDIKPSNILLGANGQAKLADFGAAAIAQTEVGDYVHGSPAYIAPERLRGARPDPRQDVYGLGGVLA